MCITEVKVNLTYSFYGQKTLIRVYNERMNLKQINSAIKNLPSTQIEEVSDGYHTFDELYDHRVALFIALANLLYSVIPSKVFTSICWKSKLHHDGSSWDGWFIAGIGIEKGFQITYHLPLDRWDDLRVVAYDKAPEFDGHTPDEVLERIKKYYS